MNIIGWLLTMTLAMTVLMEAVIFHQATVCRQKAWLKSTELMTRTLLYRPAVHEQAVDLVCKLYVSRRDNKVSWRRLPNLKKHHFELGLTGKL